MAKIIEVQGVALNVECIGAVYAGTPVIRNQQNGKKNRKGGSDFDEIECPTLVLEGCNGVGSRTFIYETFEDDEETRDADLEKIKKAITTAAKADPGK